MKVKSCLPAKNVNNVGGNLHKYFSVFSVLHQQINHQ